MGSVRWLHLSNLCLGAQSIVERAPDLWEALLHDLADLSELTGPWNLVFVTGSLTEEGSISHFGSLSRTLDGLLSYLTELGSNPSLVVVPGPNDALQLSRRPAAAWALLSYWHADAGPLRSELWSERTNEYLEAITRAFEPFVSWRDGGQRVLAGVPGWISGDLLSHVEIEGHRVEIACLNTAFLGVADARLEGEISVRQIEMLAPDPPAGDLCFLITHHAPDELHPQALPRYQQALRARAVETIHICGGMRSPAPQSDRPTVLTALPLFGLPKPGAASGPMPLIFGYAAGSFERGGGRATLSRWPRRLGYDAERRPVMGPDHTYRLNEKEAEVSSFTIRSPRPVRIPPGALAVSPRGDAVPIPDPVRPPGSGHFTRIPGHVPGSSGQVLVEGTDGLRIGPTSASTAVLGEGRVPAPGGRERVALTKHTILFLAANPVGTGILALDVETRSIRETLERSGCRERFDFVTRGAVRPRDLLEELRKLRPTVVHFSGHGSQNVVDAHRLGHEPDRDLVTHLGSDDREQTQGLVFLAENGGIQIVPAATLQETFEAAGASVRLVVLSACYSELQAAALVAHVDCVVGISGSIRDDAARSFAIGFYGGLGERESVAAAYRQGRAAISLGGSRDGELVHLKVRNGVDASQIVLAADPP